MFIRDRADLLKFVFRNQKKKTSNTNSSDPSETQQILPKISKIDALSEVVISELKALKEQQAELDTRLKLVNYQNEAHDFSFQMTFNKFFRKYFLCE